MTYNGVEYFPDEYKKSIDTKDERDAREIAEEKGPVLPI